MAHEIALPDNSVRIIDLEIPVKNVSDFFRTVPEQERELTMVKAIEVGTFCLERGRTAQDTDFIKRQIADLIVNVEKAVYGIPVKTQEALVAKIGTDDGQALAPVRHLLKSIADVSAERMNEVKKLLSENIDPSNSTSALGSALQRIRDLLDAKRNDSVQASVQSAVKAVTDRDGELSRVVKATVEEAVKPLVNEVTKLCTTVTGQETVQRALQETPEKGPWVFVESSVN